MWKFTVRNIIEFNKGTMSTFNPYVFPISLFFTTFAYAVPPLIRTESSSIGVANGSSVILECVVEAFPESLCYWERADGRSIDSMHKAFLRDQGKYKVILFSLLVHRAATAQILFFVKDGSKSYNSLRFDLILIPTYKFLISLLKIFPIKCTSTLGIISNHKKEFNHSFVLI